MRDTHVFETDCEKKGEKVLTPSENLTNALHRIRNFFNTLAKKEKNCFLCSSEGGALRTPKDIKTLFKLYSAMLFCLLEHCKHISYERGFIETLFNLENFLLDQIARPVLGFFDAYAVQEEDHLREQYIALGQVFKVDNALHINREEEIESITYKYYKKASSDSSCFSNREINLVCLLLYRRNESFRFFKVYGDRKMLINHRLAVLLSLRNESIVETSELLQQGKNVVFAFDDIAQYKVARFFIDGCRMARYFENMQHMLGLDRVTRDCREIKYEKELKNFDGIVVTKKSDVNMREFRKWYRRERQKQKWLECVKIWATNRRIDKNAVDLSMIGICAEYHEFEKGHFIFEKLQKPRTDKERKDKFIKYCLLCISALKEGNRVFINRIVSKVDDEFTRIIENTDDRVQVPVSQRVGALSSDKDTSSQARTISEIKSLFSCNNHLLHESCKGAAEKVFDKTNVTEKDNQTEKDNNYNEKDNNNEIEKNNLSHESCKTAFNKTETPSAIAQVVEHTGAQSAVKDSHLTSKLSTLRISDTKTLFDFKSDTCIEIRDASERSSVQNEPLKKDNLYNGPAPAAKSSFEGTSGSSDASFIQLWTLRLVGLLREVKKLKQETSLAKDINSALIQAIFDNILYFEKVSRREILESVLCDICINDRIVQMVLKGLYCYCVSCRESNIKTISDADLVYNFCQKVYMHWRKTRSSLDFFKRKDPSTKQEIYCCMLGVCCETDKKKEFMAVCKDFKSSSTNLNGEMIRIFERFHNIEKCGCNFFNQTSKKQDKKHIIKHLFRND